MSTIRFRADNDLKRRIVLGLRRRLPAIDFDTSPLPAIPDELVLQMAADEGRVLVSHDISTLPRIFSQWRQTCFSPGVFLVRQAWPTRQSIDQIEIVWSCSDASEWHNRLIYLPTLTDFR